MPLTREEVEGIKAHLLEAFRGERIAFGLIAKKPGEFLIVLRPHTSVKDEIVSKVKAEAATFARLQFGKDIDDGSFNVARVGEIKAE